MTARRGLAIGLTATGWHGAAWPEDLAAPPRSFDPDHWIELVAPLDGPAVDFVTIEDGFGLPDPPDAEPPRTAGRLDACLLAAALAPRTRHLGLVPTVTVTHTEPFAVATRIASLDWISQGRAGWRPQVMGDPAEVALFGRRELVSPSATLAPDDVADLLREEADVIEVVRRLWDSWEDDAEIRDRSTGRFIDRSKLHQVDFEGARFSIRGPSITPRSPQGQPLVVLAVGDGDGESGGHELAVAATGADVALAAVGPDDVVDLLASVDDAQERVDRLGPRLQVYVDLFVAIDRDVPRARAVLAELDDRAGGVARQRSAAVVGGPDDVADAIEAWWQAGVDGVRLLPARVPADLDAIARDVLPRLQRLGLRPVAPTGTLRERLGLERPANRYASQEAVR